jgi:hypothetical protein
MDDEIHRKKSNAVLKISTVVLGVLVLLGVIQAVTAGTVGVGALSFTLRETSSTTVPTTTKSGPTTPRRTSDEPLGGGLDGAVGSSSSPTENAPPSTGTKILTGTWRQARGLLTVEVTKVESQGGRLKVFVTAINASTSKMDLPVASVSAVDDTQRNYGASPSGSRWPVSIAKNSSINGYVELDQQVAAASTTFSLTFAGIIGQLAPTGGAVTVTGIPIPK